MTVKPWRNMWKKLYEAGDIDGSLCPQRCKAIRDHLSSLQLLDWQDENYQIGWYDGDGKYHRGKACKWHDSERLMEMLEPPAVAAVDNNKERGASFIRTTLIEFFESITQQPSDETIQPVLFDPEVSLRLNPDEIAPFIKPFETFVGLAA